MKNVFKWALTGVIFIYPFLTYWGLKHFEPRYVSVGLIAVVILRFFLFKDRNVKILGALSIFASLTLLGMAVLNNSGLTLKLYPVLINLIMLAVFASSLFTRQSIIERFARIHEPDLKPAAIKYTRKVTMVWCVFFIINAVISALTAITSLAAWTWYNGFFSYVLIGLLFAGEWLFRQYYKRRME